MPVKGTVACDILVWGCSWNQVHPLGFGFKAMHRFNAHQCMVCTDLCSSMRAMHRFKAHQCVLCTDSMCTNACYAQICCASMRAMHKQYSMCATHRFNAHQCMLCTDFMHINACYREIQYVLCTGSMCINA